MISTYHYCGFVYTTVSANTARRELVFDFSHFFAWKQNGSDNKVPWLILP